MAELGLPRLQEFLSCRRIEEEILHKNRGAVRRSDIGDIQNIAALNDNLRSRGRISRITGITRIPVSRLPLFLCILFLCNQSKLRYARYACQRFSAESEGVNRKQVGCICYLAGGMPQYRHLCGIAVHTAAVVDDADSENAR